MIYWYKHLACLWQQYPHHTCLIFGVHSNPLTKYQKTIFRGTTKRVNRQVHCGKTPTICLTGTRGPWLCEWVSEQRLGFLLSRLNHSLPRARAYRVWTINPARDLVNGVSGVLDLWAQNALSPAFIEHTFISRFATSKLVTVHKLVNCFVFSITMFNYYMNLCDCCCQCFWTSAFYIQLGWTKWF